MTDPDAELVEAMARAIEDYCEAYDEVTGTIHVEPQMRKALRAYRERNGK